VYDSNGICWHQPCRWRDRCRIEHGDLDDKFLIYGRCKSGRRWFWMAYDYRARCDDQTDAGAHGWEDTEQAANDAARAAIVRIADGKKAFATFKAGFASEELKDINKAKRAARSPSVSKDSKLTEYLGYSRDHDTYGFYFKRYQIIKKTAQRIYFSQ
jgi:hypothetical protein